MHHEGPAAPVRASVVCVLGRDTRGAAAAFVAVALLVGTSVATAAPAAEPSRAPDVAASDGPFPDVPATSPFSEAIGWMAAEGVATGFAQGDFHPTEPVTRQSFAAFAFRYGRAEGDASGCTSGPFPDVASSHPLCGAIAWAASNGIVEGRLDGTFDPTSVITRQSAAVLLHRLRLPAPRAQPRCEAAPFADVPTDHPFCGEITWLAERGVAGGFADGSFRPRAPVSRQVAATLLAALDAGCRPRTERPGCPRAAVPGDFDGDRQTDVAWIDREEWWRLGESEPFAHHPVASEITPMAGDWDGDGRWDPGWYDDADGAWVSASGAVELARPTCDEPPGAVGDTFARPAPGDWDGDGRTDPGWYCPADATWYLPQRQPIVLGDPFEADVELSSNLPVVGDYDGDGDDDPAVWDPRTGEVLVAGWDAPLIDTSGFGVPVAGDYDGDGVDEPALWTPDGAWELGTAMPEPGPGSGPDGLTDPTDYWWGIPAPGDYDGDGSTDEGVFLHRSEQPLRSQFVGPDGHVVELGPVRPVPAARTAQVHSLIDGVIVADECNRDPDGDRCPRPFVDGDLDGDGRTDPAWVEVATDGSATWWRVGDDEPLARSPAGTTPVTADYDGDGRWEPAWVDTDTGRWHTTARAGTLELTPPPCAATPFDAGAVPVPGNHLPDQLPIRAGGAADEPAWYCPSTGEWRLADGVTFVRGSPHPSTPPWAVGSAIASGYHDLALAAESSNGGQAATSYSPSTGEIISRFRAGGTSTRPSASPLVIPLGGAGRTTDAPDVWRPASATLVRPGRADWTPSGATTAGVIEVRAAVGDLDGDGATDGVATIVGPGAARTIVMEGAPPAALSDAAPGTSSFPITLPTPAWLAWDRLQSLERACLVDGVCPPPP